MNHRYDRRTFCQAIGAAAALAAIAPVRGEADPAGMLTRPIPSTGERLPVIGLGTSGVFDVGTDPGERAPLREVLDILIGSGGSLLDTSPMYGRAEEVAGGLIAAEQLRSRMFLATKVWTRGREAGLEQIETSMKLLRSPKLDLVQVHNLVDLDTQLATLRGLKEQGRVRYIGVTHYTVASHDELERVLKKVQLDFVQFNYSIGTREAEERLLPLAAERKVAVLVNRPFEDGALFNRVRGQALPAWAAEIDCESWAQFFLKFIVGHPSVTCVIPATSKPRHMRDNAAAGHGRMPDGEMRERMANYLASL
ncbi:MAG: aldo/keto reductase [Steroidobacteraceae bacterium]|nr:aldo/keto reductase [Steroidobacteraceae bacterium]